MTRKKVVLKKIKRKVAPVKKRVSSSTVGNAVKSPVKKDMRKTGLQEYKQIKLKVVREKKSNITPSEQKKLLNFLNSFKHKHTYVYNADGRDKIQNFNHTSILGEAIKANEGVTLSDVYFYINGERKQADVKKAYSCYIDLDAGRDSKGKYLGPAQVTMKKKNMVTFINKFGLSPSWVVETRNGFQLYWILDSPCSNMIYWNGLQKKLVNYFAKVGSDNRAIKPNQIFRVPFTKWNKVWENKSQYITRICDESNGHTVNAVDLEAALQGQKTSLKKMNYLQSSDYWAKIKAGNANPAKTILNTGIVVANNPKNINTIINSNISMDEQKTKSIELTIQFLNQVQNILSYTNNKFLASSAKMLAEQLGDNFCI